MPEVALALVYFDVASQTEVELRQVCGHDELEDLLAQRCGAFLAWARQEALHRGARDAALQTLAFPRQAFRTGQRALAEAVYKAAANQRCLLAQAPTGIGKTVGTLFPLLRAMPLHGIDKLAYLTCKGTGRRTALTDGVTLAGPGPRFPHGALYALHADTAVAAFDLGQIATALQLAPACRS